MSETNVPEIAMESTQEQQDLHDDYPVGWILTYRSRTSGANHAWSTGVVAGPPARDPRTGLEAIPLVRFGGGSPGRTVWGGYRDVVGIEPR